MYGLSIHDQPGGSAVVRPINGEDELRARLKAFGLSDDYAEDVIKRLKEKHDSVKLTPEE
jgi:Fe2+ transport system protein FeoA